MNEGKGQTIFLSVIGIATLLVAIIGATFAWFSVNVSGNDEASSIFVTTAVLGSITFTDGTEIRMENIRPETSPSRTKTFTVANTGEGSNDLTSPIHYKVTLDVVTNTLSAKANKSQGAPIVNGDYFVHSLASEAATTDLTSATLTGTCTPAHIAMAETAVPTADTQLGDTNTNVGTICGTATHSYTYTIAFKEAEADQNAAQGQSFVGRLQVATTTVE